MPDSDLPERDLVELAALADGRLAPERAQALRARFATEPALAAEYARQQRAIALVTSAAADVQAPLALRERIEAQRSQAPARRRPAWRRLLLPAAAGGALAATAAAIVIALGGGAPGVSDTLSSATAPAAIGVTVSKDVPQLLAIARDGVPFPNFAKKFGWTATGARTDELDGHPTTTVFYEQDGREIAYTIVGGEALEVPDGDRVASVDGRDFTVLRSDGRTVVTWERGGHTCVLSGTDVPGDELVELAAWKGKGAIPF